MVIVRRRSDGKFYTNKAKHWSQNDSYTWTEDISKCKPFMREASARQALYHYEPRDKDCPHFTTFSYHYSGGIGKRFKKDCPCEKARRLRGRAHFDKKFEIVNLKVEAKLA